MVIEYFGNEHIVAMSQQYILKFGQKGEKRAMIYTGLPGVGKTYLTEYMAQLCNAELYTVNASEKRTGEDVGEILKTVKNRSPMIAVLDECEAMSSKNLERIIKATQIPLFLCCNYIEMIDREVVELCTICKINPPPWWVFRQYMEAAMKRYGIEIPSDIEARAKKAKSFRHAERLIDDPDDLAPERIETEYTQVEKIFHGIPIEHISMKPDTLLHWVNDNAGIPELASCADVLLEHSYLDDYHHWSYVYSLLQAVRSSNKVVFPRSFNLKAKVRRELKEQNRADRETAMSSMKIDFTQVDVTAVKSGESLFEGLDELNITDLK